MTSWRYPFIRNDLLAYNRGRCADSDRSVLLGQKKQDTRMMSGGRALSQLLGLALVSQIFVGCGSSKSSIPNTSTHDSAASMVLYDTRHGISYGASAAYEHLSLV